MVTMDKQWCTFNVLRISTTYNGYKTSKYASNFKFPYYHPLNLWLLWATNGNQEQTVMHPPLHTPSVYPLCVPPPHTPSAYPSAYPLRIPPPRTPSAYPSVYPLCVPPPHTPSALPRHVPPPHTPSVYPLHVSPPHTPSTYPLRVLPLHIPPRTPSAYPLRVRVPPPRTPPHTPSTYPLRVPEWIWLVNVPTTANQITGIEKAN